MHFLYVQQHQVEHLSKSPSWRPRTFPKRGRGGVALCTAGFVVLVIKHHLACARLLVCLSACLVPRASHFLSPRSSLFVCTTADLDYGCRRVCSSLDTVAVCSFAFCARCPHLVASKAFFVEPHRRRSPAAFTHHNHSSLSTRSKGPIPPLTQPTPSRPTHYPEISWSAEEETMRGPRCCFRPLAPTRLVL